MNKKEVLDRYRTAFRLVHGAEPNIQCRGGWYFINECGGFRLFQIDEMAANLEMRPERHVAARPMTEIPQPEEESDLLTIAYMDGYYRGKDYVFVRMQVIINRWCKEADRLEQDAADLSRSCRDADATRRLAEAKLRRALADELERTLEGEK